MNITFNYILAILLLSISFASFTCRNSTQQKSSQPDVVQQDTIDTTWIPATVRNLSGLDGCGFVIELDNETRLLPKELKSEFQVDGLKVLIKYIRAKNMMTVCMAGEPVTITDIKKR